MRRRVRSGHQARHDPHQWICWSSAGQTFDAVGLTDGFKIVDRNSKLCLSPAAGSTKLGAAVTIETCTGGTDQTWAPLARGGDDIGLKN